jgi:hypothetical protein
MESTLTSHPARTPLHCNPRAPELFNIDLRCCSGSIVAHIMLDRSTKFLVGRFMRDMRTPSIIRFSGHWDGLPHRRGDRDFRKREHWIPSSNLQGQMVRDRGKFDDTRAEFPRPHSARDRVSLFDAKADRPGPSTGTLNGPLTSTSRTPSATVSLAAFRKSTSAVWSPRDSSRVVRIC